jgi:hypothetical protein
MADCVGRSVACPKAKRPATAAPKPTREQQMMINDCFEQLGLARDAVVRAETAMEALAEGLDKDDEVVRVAARRIARRLWAARETMGKNL